MAQDYIYTDDEAKGLPFGYMGPVGLELPPARPAAWGVAGLLTLTGWFLVWLLAPTFWIGVLGFVVVPVPGIGYTRKLMRFVDYYRPVRHWISVGRAELTTPRRTRTQAEAREASLEPSIFKEGPRR